MLEISWILLSSCSQVQATGGSGFDGYSTRQGSSLSIVDALHEQR